MRTHHNIPKEKAVKLSFGTRRRKPWMLSIKSHGTMAVSNVFEEDDTINESSDDEKCQVLRTNEKEDTEVSSDEDLDTEVSSDEDLFHNEIDEGTTAESPIDLTESDESSDEEADNES